MPERWVHLDHPDMVADWIDRDGDGNIDGGYRGLEHLIDGSETRGLSILDGVPYHIREPINSYFDRLD